MYERFIALKLFKLVKHNSYLHEPYCVSQKDSDDTICSRIIIALGASIYSINEFSIIETVLVLMLNKSVALIKFLGLIGTLVFFVQ